MTETKSTALALPEPKDVTLAGAGDLAALAATARELAWDERDIDLAAELRRRLDAYRQYVSNKTAKDALVVETRRTERLIGLLLGPPELGANQHAGAFDSGEGSGISKDDRHKFRRLAWWQPSDDSSGCEAIPDDAFEAALLRQADRSKLLVELDRWGTSERYRRRPAAPPPAPKDETTADVDESATDDDAAPALAPEPEPLELGRVYDGDFLDLGARIPDESVDLVFTDPPYDRAAVALYEPLAKLAARVLRPGGSLIAYAGHYALPEILTSCGYHLRYWWMLACYHEGGNHKSLPGVKAYVLWKPLVWFVKGTNGSNEFVYDLIARPTPDKADHDWSQALAEPLHYIEKLVPTGGVVLDPMCGAGTTLVAAKQLDRQWLGIEQNADTAARARTRLGK